MMMSETFLVLLRLVAVGRTVRTKDRRPDYPHETELRQVEPTGRRWHGLVMLTASDVTELLTEISPLLRGGWIQKIQQPAGHTLVLDVRVPGQTHRLLICCHPNLARLHVTTHSLANPPTPPPFCQFLRAHFQGARIDDICQIDND